MSKIYLLNISVNASGINEKLTEKKCTSETDKHYIILREGKWKSDTKHLNKDEILKVSSGVVRDDIYGFIGASVWFLEDQKEEATKMAYEYLRERIQIQYDTSLKMTEHFNNFIASKNK